MMFLSSLLVFLLFLVSSTIQVQVHSKEEHRILHHQKNNHDHHHHLKPSDTDCFDEFPEYPATPAELTEDQLKTLHYMRSQEQFARDMYSLFFQEYDLRVFQHNHCSEQTHMEAIQKLLAIQGESFAPATFGKYPLPSGYNNAIQDMWDSLTNDKNELADGAFDNVVDALEYSVEIEVTDILDLQDALNQLSGTDAPYTQHVYENLIRTSENNLRSYVRALEATGGTFDISSTAMDEEKMGAILTSGVGREYGGVGVYSKPIG